jgi:glycosyltransferase involved in cell wall biosynthesis
MHDQAQSSGDIDLVPVLAWRRALDFLKPSLIPSCQLLKPEGKLGTALTSGIKMRSLRPDVIHCCFVVPPFTGNAPVIATILDLGFVRYKEHYPRLLAGRLVTAMHHAVRRADKLISISECTRNDLLELSEAKENQVQTVYLGLDDRFVPDNSKSDHHGLYDKYGIRQPYLLYAGKLEPRKNVETLIAAYNRLRSANQFSGQLVLLGSPRTFMWELAQKRIEQSPFRKDIVQTGFVPDVEVPKIYAGARALAFVSLYEGFGIPVVEAMASSVPIVCSNTTCLPEIAGDAAILVPPQDEVKVADALNIVLNDDNVREKLIQKGLQRAKIFTWEKAASQTLQIYRDVAARSIKTS